LRSSYAQKLLADSDISYHDGSLHCLSTRWLLASGVASAFPFSHVLPDLSGLMMEGYLNWMLLVPPGFRVDGLAEVIPAG
jgi:hypothetical protein